MYNIMKNTVALLLFIFVVIATTIHSSEALSIEESFRKNVVIKHLETYVDSPRIIVFENEGRWFKNRITYKNNYTYEIDQIELKDYSHQGTLRFELLMERTDPYDTEREAKRAKLYTYQDTDMHVHKYLYAKNKWIVVERKNEGPYGSFRCSWVNGCKEEFLPSKLGLLAELSEIIIYDDIEALKERIGRGIDLNSRVKGSLTPLLLAIKEGKLKVAEILIENGADVNFTTDVSYPLHHAAYRDNPEMVSLLLRKGADIEVRKLGEATPLFDAVENGNIENVSILLEAGANVNAIDDYRRNSLHRLTEEIIYNNRLDAAIAKAKILVKHGISTSQREKIKGYTPLEWIRHKAEDENDEELMSWIDNKLAPIIR
jgi:hypothetical protein